MPDDVPPRKHITEALGGQHVAPLTHGEREEHERVRNLLQAVLSCYNSLISRETDDTRRAGLEAKRAVYTDEFRRRLSLSAAERSEVLHTYPGLLAGLRAELGE